MAISDCFARAADHQELCSIVVTTMLDDSIPLTTSEYDEWGNPNEKIYYDYMLSYSPYDNVRPIDYPNLLVTTGLHDSQVQYFEPAKWVAALREHAAVVPGGRVAPHGLVHGRRHQDRGVGRQAQRGEQVVGQPVRESCDEIRAGRHSAGRAV